MRSKSLKLPPLIDSLPKTFLKSSEASKMSLALINHTDVLQRLKLHDSRLKIQEPNFTELEAALDREKNEEAEARIDPTEQTVAALNLNNNNESPQEQKYGYLWTLLSQVSCINEKEECRIITARTQPILQQFQKNIIQKEQQLRRANQCLQREYLRCHEQYQKIKVYKSKLLASEKERKINIKQLRQKHKNYLLSQILAMVPQNPENSELKKQIGDCKECILQSNNILAELNRSIKILRKDIKNQRNGLIQFLTESLKHGLDSRSQGIAWIIKDLMALGVRVTPDHLPIILDPVSKDFLLNKAQKMYSKNTSRSSTFATPNDRSQKLPFVPKTRSISFNPSRGSIIEEETGKIKDIYENTKLTINQYIKDRSHTQHPGTKQKTNSSHHQHNNLKESSIKSTLTLLQSIDSGQASEIQEYRRIHTAYPREIHHIVCRIVFGLNWIQLRIKA